MIKKKEIRYYQTYYPLRFLKKKCINGYFGFPSLFINILDILILNLYIINEIKLKKKRIILILYEFKLILVKFTRTTRNGLTQFFFRFIFHLLDIVIAQIG